ncbi:MAG: DUF192 domain-containing protein [Candidatus Pacearchaeota archaeon]
MRKNHGKTSFRYKGKELNVEIRVCSFFGRIRGLMFRRRERANALLFDFKKDVGEPIHSFFVFFPFVAVWLDGKGSVVEVRRVKPFRFYVSPRKKFRKLVEIPINSGYSKIVKRLLG